MIFSADVLMFKWCHSNGLCITFVK